MSSFATILFAIQVLVTIVTFFRENGKDERFDGDKLEFRI